MSALILITQPASFQQKESKRLFNSIRGERVMLDRDLAALYGVETKVLKQAVKRNIDRFPLDFMFVLTPAEFRNWRSQFVTSNADRKGLRHAPMAFTEHGILMLSSVLNSKRAVDVNIEIMRAFVRLRQMLSSNAQLSRRLDELERKYDSQFKVVFNAIRSLMAPLGNQKKSDFAPVQHHERASHERKVRVRWSPRTCRVVALKWPQKAQNVAHSGMETSILLSI